ncbi:sialate O-acetylesterase isoform X3 [Pezoporus flaviventris]|uniref:sialate O-acetylesterase isoform X3 n=1 Tax=Pezoporus flaviventris TaxID=889875 RepID=UPI002AB31F10|nr:sialate O-acetylesterase isoform X3 [Pezoporus flaviventris]
MAAWALLALAPVAAGAILSFASYYGDHMVLQKEPAGAVVWGYGEPGAAVTVALSGDGGLVLMKKMAQVKEPSGTWMTILDPMDQGGPYTLTARQGSENVTLRDIYFGDVWLCSGQSNMVMTVLQKAWKWAFPPFFPLQPDVSWTENLGHGNFTYFSAVCWLLGRYLYDALRYPVGLVEAAWGGTPIEAWSSPRALQACGLLEDMRSPALSPSISPHQHFSGPQTPSVLWNAMIHPLLNMTLRGIAWYQGEANAFLHTDQYNCTFPALIADWRQAFHVGSAGQTEPLLPFGFVQLSTYRRQSPQDSFARLRWHQTADVGVVPNARMPRTFMAVAMDLCDEHSPYGSIHPRDKHNVAHRLQLGARAVAYGEKNLVFQGPFPTRAVLEVTRALLNVTYSQRLVWRRRDMPAFEVCCSSPVSLCRWLPAPMVAVGSHMVTLALGGCGTLVLALRYAWAEWPCEYQSCALYNTQGLPAPPFLLETLRSSSRAGEMELLLLHPSSLLSWGI